MKIFYENSNVNEKDIEEIKNKILKTTEIDFTQTEQRLKQILDDKNTLNKINQIAEKFKNFEKIILIGIGGSSLGTLAVYSALKFKLKKEIIFFETLDSLKISELNKNLNQSFLILLISKSGKTLESIINFEIVKKFFPEYKNQTIIITDQGSILDEYAKKEKIEIVYSPSDLSGRFTFFTPVSLLPLKLVSVDIEKLIKGAKNFDKEIALKSASLIYYHYLKNRNIYNIFLFHPFLENLGFLYRQLIAESLGKEGKGISPLVSIATCDLHSMYQLYLHGPNDKFTCFIFPDKVDMDYKIEKVEFLEFKKFENETIHSLIKKIYSAVKSSYKKYSLPYYEIIFDRFSEEELGNFIQTKYFEIVYLAKLLRVNPFNQPAVEEYKSLI